jgi:quercetin dioxygenase-like cupin family protein
MIQARFEFAPGGAAQAHSQPGDEIVHVSEGTIERLMGEGPPVTLSAGGVPFIPAGATRSARNVGGTGAAADACRGAGRDVGPPHGT